MKKRFVKVFACMAVTAMMLSVTACGSKEAAAETAEAVEETATEETEAEVEEEVEAEAEEVEEATEEVAEEAATTDATTLEDYYNDPTVKAAMDAAFASFAEDGMSAAVEMKENTMTAIIKIEDESYIVDGIGDMLQAALEENAATFEEQAAEFDEVIGESGACTVVMRYVDPQDNVLAEKAFTAK
ncbi:MAG: DUF4854 domain-containing protein [Lachnospiraceae bacterium]